jgi:hypothetical protein
MGNYLSMSIGTDGYPVLAYQDATAGALKFYQCGSYDCSLSTSRDGNITATSSSLMLSLDKTGYERVLTSDGEYDTQSGATSTRLAYHMELTHGNNSDPIDITWEGKLSVATATYLQIWNRTSSRWETAPQNLSPTSGFDFVLSNATTTVSHYYDASSTYRIRLLTGTTTSTTLLSSDVFGVTPQDPSVSTLHYRFRADNGDEVGAEYLGNEDTPILSRLHRGDRVRLRLLLSSVGPVSASNFSYRLESSSGACTSWSAVGSVGGGEAWVMDYSQYILNGTPTTNASSLTDPGGKSFVSGVVQVSSSTASSLTLTSSQFTELEYVITSTSAATSDTTYCFRVTNAGSLSYLLQNAIPQIVLSSQFRSVSGGPQNIESMGVGPQVGGGNLRGGQGNESEGTGTHNSGGSQSGGAGSE